MSALPLEQPHARLALPPEADQLLALARSLGPLRRAEAHQAGLLRAATELDRSLRPRWQRHGDGVHQWATPATYTRGRRWVRTREPVPDDAGRRQWRRLSHTNHPHTNWRTREHWLQVVVPAAIELKPTGLNTRRGNVNAATFLAYCRELSKYANPGTGRRCIVRVDRLADLLEVSKSTVQRCQLAAEQLGLYAVVQPGRMLTFDERRQAHNSGSRQRGLANDAVLVIPHWLPRERVNQPAPAPPQARCDTPTRGRYRKNSHLQLVSSFSPQKRRSAGIPEPPPSAQHQPKQRESSTGPSRSPEGPQGRSSRFYDRAALHLALELIEALPWLAGTPAGRLEPMLRRFTGCRQPWRAGDIVTVIDQTNARLQRASMTRSLVRHPPARLAAYLRDVDVDNDHPRADHADPPPGHPRPALRLTPTQLRNQLLLEAHRGAGAAHGPAIAAPAAARIRADLRKLGQLRQQRDPTPDTR